MTHSLVSKFAAIIFSLIIHTENCYFMGNGIRVLDHPRKQQKLVPHEKKVFIICGVVFRHKIQGKYSKHKKTVLSLIFHLHYTFDQYLVKTAS